MKKLLGFVTICLGALSLVGCNNTQQEIINITKDDAGTATIKIFKDENSTLDECYIAPKNVNMSLTYEAISGTLSNNQTVCPSIGDVNLLVIPVHIPGSEEYRTEQVRNDIERVFFSKNDDRLGYPSLSEYYYTSSFGKLNFSGEVTEWFDVAKYTTIQSADDVSGGSSGTIVQEILPAAIKWAVEEQGIDLSKYDYNKDYYIDGIWLVYDHLDTYSDTALNPDAELNTVYWNMTSWNWDSVKSEEVIKQEESYGYGTSAFSWASFDMMYTGYCDYDGYAPIFGDFSDIKLSSHTYIHETGHLLGLEDFYATDSATYRPSGKFNMMDQNVGDLDTYSKMVLGWVTPYVVYGGSEILLQEVNANDHQAIVIPSNYEEINEEVKKQTEQGYKPEEIKISFNPFSEYILIDLYAPTGNNYYDVKGTILNDRVAGVDKTGVRIYHIDSRIFKCTAKTLNGQTQIIFNQTDYIWDGSSTLRNDQAIFMPITNNVGTANIDINTLLGNKIGINFNTFDQVRLIEASGVNTFDRSGDFAESTLWYEDTKPFNIYDFGMQFFYGTYQYNDGTSLPFYIDVTSLKEVE